MKNKDFQFNYSFNVLENDGQGLYYYEDGILKYYNWNEMIDLRESLDSKMDQELKSKLNHFMIAFKLKFRG